MVGNSRFSYSGTVNYSQKAWKNKSCFYFTFETNYGVSRGSIHVIAVEHHQNWTWIKKQKKKTTLFFIAIVLMTMTDTQIEMILTWNESS